jgi:hypothetical protein
MLTFELLEKSICSMEVHPKKHIMPMDKFTLGRTILRKARHPENASDPSRMRESSPEIEANLPHE